MAHIKNALVACVYLLLLPPSSGFSAVPVRTAGRRLNVLHHSVRPRRCGAVMSNEPSTPPPAGPPLRSALIALLTVQSAAGLATEVPSLLGDNPDVLRAGIDMGICIYGIRTLLTQFGVLAGSQEQGTQLAGLECSATLNIGREPGTWMPAEWGASGARLSLPTTLRFTDEVVDLGFPGEEAFSDSRYAKRLYCDGGSFIGAQGEVVVPAAGGAWATTRTREGESALRFFVEFPQTAERNDVRLPAGRVWFSSVCWDSAEQCADLVGSESESMLLGPAGAQLLPTGGLTVKRNNIRNLFGALGDVNLILGRFSLSSLGGTTAK